MDVSEFKLMECADCKGASSNALTITLGLESFIGHSHKPNAEKLTEILNDTERAFEPIESYYITFDPSPYDSEHGGDIFRKLKEQTIPQFRMLLDDFKKKVNTNQANKYDSNEIKRLIKSMLQSGVKLRSLCYDVSQLPKYAEYRKESEQRPTTK